MHIQLVSSVFKLGRVIAYLLTRTRQPGGERNAICCRERYAGGDFNLSVHRVNRIHPKQGTFISRFRLLPEYLRYFTGSPRTIGEYSRYDGPSVDLDQQWCSRRKPLVHGL